MSELQNDIPSTDQHDSSECACECGKSKFKINSQPLIRFRCHCTICQEVYQKPYADFVIMREQDIDLPKLNGIQFKRHKAPPAVDRGKCPSCRKPVIGWFRMIPGLPLAMFPIDVISDHSLLPAPLGHIFYKSRVQDVDDDLPKYDGFLSSEWQVFKQVFKTLR